MPKKLDAQNLHLFANTINIKELRSLDLSNCVECGDCDAVCPSHIPLTKQFKLVKQQINKFEKQQIQAKENLRRYQAKLKREEKRKQQKKTVSKSLVATSSSLNENDNKQAVIAAAVKRVREKRKSKVQ